MKYLQQASQSLVLQFRTFHSEPYQKWKYNNHLLWNQLTFKPILLISLLFFLVRLGFSYDQLKVQISLGVLPVLSTLLYWLHSKAHLAVSPFIELLPFLQQQSVNWFCILLFAQDSSFVMLFSIVNVSFLSLYETVTFKLLAVLAFSVEAVLFIKLDSFEGLVLSICILFVHILRKELQEINYFKKLQALFLIIDSIPHAMCIVHKNKDLLLYSNKYFENLSLTLQGSSNSSEGDQSPEKQLNHTRSQLKFLQNLQLNEFNPPVPKFVDFDADEATPDDQYRILKVIYRKDSQPLFPSLDPQKPDKRRLQQKEFFTSFKQPQEISRKTYTSDVTLQVELLHQPQVCIQSAKKKSHRKKSSYGLKTNRKLSSEQLIKDSGLKNSLLDGQTASSPAPPLNQKMKFLVHVMENYKLFDSDEDLQIYFIHDMNPYLLRSRLKKLESAKRNLMRSISHELLTSINVVYGCVKQCQDLKMKQEDFLRELDLASKYLKMQMLKVQDFFDYREILDGKLVLKQDTFDINSVINECVDLIRDQIVKRGLALQCDLPANKYYINGDRQRLCQVLLNLLSNAIKFTGSGSVSVQVKHKTYQNSMQIHEDDESSSIGQLEITNIIEVWVKDTGIGMTETELSILRKKLLIADEDEKVSERSVGIGLGLSVCKSIIKLMAPSSCPYLFVESIKEQGTSFYFCLQYLDETLMNSGVKASNFHTIPHDVQSTQQVKVMAYKSKHIRMGIKLGSSQRLIEVPQVCRCKKLLIVDDESFNQHVLKHLTTSMGFESDLAINGKEALDKVKDQLDRKCCNSCQGYYAILMDINMPIMGGWEAIQRLRQMELERQLLKTIPVIAVTAFCSMRDQEQSIQEGFNMVLLKPVTKEQLEKAFQRLGLL